MDALNFSIKVSTYGFTEITNVALTVTQSSISRCVSKTWNNSPLRVLQWWCQSCQKYLDRDFRSDLGLKTIDKAGTWSDAMEAHCGEDIIGLHKSIYSCRILLYAILRFCTSRRTNLFAWDMRYWRRWTMTCSQISLVVAPFAFTFVSNKNAIFRTMVNSHAARKYIARWEQPVFNRSIETQISISGRNKVDAAEAFGADIDRAVTNISSTER